MSHIDNVSLNAVIRVYSVSDEGLITFEEVDSSMAPFPLEEWPYSKQDKYVFYRPVYPGFGENEVATTPDFVGIMVKEV